MLNIFSIISSPNNQDYKYLFTKTNYFFKFNPDSIIFFRVDLLIFFLFLFFFSVLAIICYRENFLITLLAIELMYLCLIMIFLISSVIFGNLIFQVHAMILMCIIVVESVMGLCLLFLMLLEKNQGLSERIYSAGGGF
jgi:NADH:ubiquinone oxidoreductase subunit K